MSCSDDVSDGPRCRIFDIFMSPLTLCCVTALLFVPGCANCLYSVDGMVMSVKLAVTAQRRRCKM